MIRFPAPDVDAMLVKGLVWLLSCLKRLKVAKSEDDNALHEVIPLYIALESKAYIALENCYIA